MPEGWVRGWFMAPMRAWKTVGTFHEPSRLRLADPRSGPRLCEALRFMAPMRDRKLVGALHEPPLSGPSATLSSPCGERAGRGVPIRFMVPMHAEKRKRAPHEPDFGRYIALRCPRPRISGRNLCAAERGVDGAARRPHQVQGFNARKPISENSFPDPVRIAFGTRLSA